MNLDKVYIAKRKAKALLCSLVYYACRFLPIKRNKIVFWTFEGTRGFCCSPKYIAEEILRQSKEWDIVWLVNDMQCEFPTGIRKSRNTLWNRAYHLTTAKIWIGNTRTTYGTKKRKEQIYIQTWHGSVGVKPIGRYRGDAFPEIARIVSEADSKMIDYVLSGSDWGDEHYPDGLLYDGDIIRTGMPRCDVLVKDRDKTYMRIRREYGIPEGAKIVMCAPTFRGGSQRKKREIAAEKLNINFEKLIKILEQKYGGDWYVFLRLHPQLAAEKRNWMVDNLAGRIIDVTQHQDMNELLAATDVFITDYSSTLFEAALIRIPCFIFAEDIESYIKERNGFFFDVKQLPFPLVTESDELVHQIEIFTQEEYEKSVDVLMREIGILEDGEASKRVVKLLEKIIENS